MGEPVETDGGAGDRLELAHYAWVSAALAEGFALSEVLGVEGLEPTHWQQAELAWRTRLATDPTVVDEYRAHLAEAEDELGSQVTPLGDDLEAWVVFLRVYGDHPSPFELLAESKLRPGDLARLQRAWARRLEADAGLARRAVEVREKVAERTKAGRALELPAITVARGALHASRYARALPLPTAQPQAAVERPGGLARVPPAPELSLYDYAALCAALDDEGVDEERVLQVHGLSRDDRERVERFWRARMAADPTVAADFRNLHRHFNEREGFRSDTPPTGGGVPLSATPAPRPVLPAGPSASAAMGSSPPAARPVSAAPPAGPAGSDRSVPYHPELGMTLEGVSSLPQIALPFVTGQSSERPASGAQRAPAGAPAESRRPPPKPGYNKDLARTAKVGDRVPPITLPFRAVSGSAAAAAEISVTKSPRADGRSGEAGKASTPPPSPAVSARKEPAGDDELGRTAQVGARVPHITLPFQAKSGADVDAAPPADHSPPTGKTADSAAEPDPLGATIALDAGGSSLPAGPVVAGWQVNHYASLCAELAEHPERAAAIRARYGLADEAAEQLVHERWQMEFVDNDGTRREWQRLLQEYRRALAKAP